MKRRLLNIPAALSLLVCVATVALWVRSYYVIEWVGRIHYTPGIDSEDHHLYLQSNHGIVQVFGGGDPAENFSDVRWVWERLHPPYGAWLGSDAPRALRAIGIGWVNPMALSTGEMHWAVQIRLALPASLSALAAGLFLVGGQFRRGSGERSCRACGYDLRATTERCPECGTTPTEFKPDSRSLRQPSRE